MLAELAPLTLPGWAGYTGTDEVGREVRHGGYGRTGTGTTGMLPWAAAGGMAEVHPKYELTATEVERTGFAVALADVFALTLTTSTADNHFLIHGTPAVTTIHAGGGANLFHLSPDGRNLGQLTRGLTLNGQGGNDQVVADDRNHASTAPHTLTGSALARAGFAGVDFWGAEGV